MRTVAMDVNRVQTGVRLEKRLVKVLKALAELQDLSLGEFMENLVHRAFTGQQAFEEPALVQVRELMRIYGMDPSGLGSAQTILGGEAGDSQP
jgi:hypothetical protein